MISFTDITEINVSLLDEECTRFTPYIWPHLPTETTLRIFMTNKFEKQLIKPSSEVLSVLRAAQACLTLFPLFLWLTFSYDR